MPSLFEYLDSINSTKNYLMVDQQSEKDYVPYMINRGLSQFHDTCLYANEINRYADLPKKMMYDFYMHSIPKRKRFSKWAKADKSSADLEMISRYFCCSYEKGKQIMTILTPGQVEDIRAVTDTGGRK